MWRVGRGWGGSVPGLTCPWVWFECSNPFSLSHISLLDPLTLDSVTQSSDWRDWSMGRGLWAGRIPGLSQTQLSLSYCHPATLKRNKSGHIFHFTLQFLSWLTFCFKLGPSSLFVCLFICFPWTRKAKPFLNTISFWTEFVGIWPLWGKYLFHSVLFLPQHHCVTLCALRKAIWTREKIYAHS